jgi:hypothetical protein
MRKLSIATIGGLWGAAALGQDLIECIDPDEAAQGSTFS